MSKITFECEVDVKGDERIEGVELLLLRGGKWKQAVAFVFSRPQRIRDGKHIKINRSVATIVTVGEALPDDEKT